MHIISRIDMPMHRTMRLNSMEYDTFHCLFSWVGYEFGVYVYDLCIDLWCRTYIYVISILKTCFHMVLMIQAMKISGPWTEPIFAAHPWSMLVEWNTCTPYDSSMDLWFTYMCYINTSQILGIPSCSYTFKVDHRWKSLVPSWNEQWLPYVISSILGQNMS